MNNIDIPNEPFNADVLKSFRKFKARTRPAYLISRFQIKYHEHCNKDDDYEIVVFDEKEINEKDNNEKESNEEDMNKADMNPTKTEKEVFIPCSCCDCCLEDFLFLELLLRLGDLPAFTALVAVCWIAGTDVAPALL